MIRLVGGKEQGLLLRDTVEAGTCLRGGLCVTVTARHLLPAAGQVLDAIFSRASL